MLHLSQSIEGALKYWTRKDWVELGKENNLSGDECKKFFENYREKGWKVIPMGDCDNFDYKKGCMGHGIIR